MKSCGLVKHWLHVCLHLRLLQHQTDRAMTTVTSSRAATEPPTISSVNTDSSADTARARSVESVVFETTMAEVEDMVLEVEETVVVVVVVVGEVGCVGSVGV